jgi:hypothetical protein
MSSPIVLIPLHLLQSHQIASLYYMICRLPPQPDNLTVEGQVWTLDLIKRFIQEETAYDEIDPFYRKTFHWGIINVNDHNLVGYATLQPTLQNEYTGSMLRFMVQKDLLMILSDHILRAIEQQPAFWSRLIWVFPKTLHPPTDRLDFGPTQESLKRWNEGPNGAYFITKLHHCPQCPQDKCYLKALEQMPNYSKLHQYLTNENPQRPIEQDPVALCVSRTETTIVNDHIHPKIEVKRKQLVEQLFKDFHTIVTKSAGPTKKFKFEYAQDYIARFCWVNSTDDPIIPYQEDPSKYNFKQLETDLENFGVNKDDILGKLNLVERLKKDYAELMTVYNSVDLDKDIAVVTNDKQKRTLTYGGVSIEYQQKIYDNLQRHFRGHRDQFEMYSFCLLCRYSYIDAGNQQLAINLGFKEDMKQTLGLNIELFGSAFNRFYDQYCSLSYDLERFYGSLGNFFSLQPKMGLYMANPPYSEDIMEGMARKLDQSLRESVHPLGFIITIPVWDYATRQKLNESCVLKTVEKKEYGVYQCLNVLRRSPYFYKKYTFCKENFQYYSFKKNQFIPAAPTYVIVLKNQWLCLSPQKLESMMDRYKLIRQDEPTPPKIAV